MPLSGIYDFIQTRDNIIFQALRDVNLVALGGTPSATLTTEAANKLETLTKALVNKGVRVWLYEWLTQTLTASTIITGTDSLDYTCILSHTSADANRPITGAEWPVYWIRRGTGGSGWVTSTAYNHIGDFQPASMTSVLDTSIIGVNNAYIREVGSAGTHTDIPLIPITSDQWADIEFKWQSGVPEVIYWDRRAARMHLYPPPDASVNTYVLRYQVVRLPQDFDAATNNSDLSVRGEKMLIDGLAYEYADREGLPTIEIERKRLKFEQSLRDYVTFDEEIIQLKHVLPGLGVRVV